MKAMFILLMVAGLCSAYTYLDQLWETAIFDGYLAGNVQYAEDFIAGCDGALQNATVWVYDMSEVGDLTIQLWSNNPEGGPGAMICSTQINDIDWEPGTYNTHYATVELPSSFAVTWGQTYWLAIEPDMGSALVRAEQQPEWGEWCYEYMGGQWGPVANKGFFVVVEGSDLGLESSTWGTIKAAW